MSAEDDLEVAFTADDEETTIPDEDVVAYAIQRYAEKLAGEDEEPPGLLLKAVVVAEFVNSEGRYTETWRIPDPNYCSIWEAKGLLQHALDEIDFDDD